MNQDSGIILLDKPKGISSRKALDAVIKKVHLTKAGHAGTIDPAASGLLVILSGKATKLNKYILCTDKLYSFTLLFGVKTDTDDSEGKIIDQKEPGELSRSELEKVLHLFTGDILQKPPIHSAVKVNGKRAYKLARKGIDPVLKERNVSVKSIRITLFDWPRVRMETLVSSGTYVRSLARDIGDSLGVGAYCEDIRRLSVGNMRVEEAGSLDDDLTFYPVEKALSHLPEISEKFTEKDFFEDTDKKLKYALMRKDDGTLHAVLEKENQVLKYNKIF
ncbi:tRNA pseudouridine(55) synthase TruB [candidate division WOR-3 bacterium]|nr:tRNA pseudouridine(55) synthase TruB [candidate division WOR-3 bacterium]